MRTRNLTAMASAVVLAACLTACGSASADEPVPIGTPITVELDMNDEKMRTVETLKEVDYLTSTFGSDYGKAVLVIDVENTGDIATGPLCQWSWLSDDGVQTDVQTSYYVDDLDDYEENERYDNFTTVMAGFKRDALVTVVDIPEGPGHLVCHTNGEIHGKYDLNNQ